METYRMGPASIIAPHIEELSIDILIDFWSHGNLFPVGGSRFKPVVLDGDLMDMGVNWDDFLL